MSRVVIVALLALATFAGCGSETTERPASPPAAGAFPVTLKHKFGSTTITSPPKRIVVVGLREQDSLLALGIVPVGTTEWYGDHPGAIFPWAKQALGDAELLEKLSFTDVIKSEKVAALTPYLIFAIYSGINQKDYDTLSKI